MTTVFEVDPARPEEADGALNAAAEALAAGLLVVVPTETVYGIAARPQLEAAAGRLFAAKRRPSNLNLPVLAATAGEALALARAPAGAHELAATFWPGPLTMVLPRGEASLPWRLGDRADTIGLRVPGHPLTMELLGRSGPLAVTSANLSGHPPLTTRDDLIRTLGGDVEIFLVVPGEETRPPGPPSTVVDLTADPPLLLREGGISMAAIEATLSMTGSSSADRPGR